MQLKGKLYCWKRIEFDILQNIIEAPARDFDIFGEFEENVR
jgi:hypothetical protein